MANTIDWGEASVNNTNGYGKGAINNTIRWGKIYESSASGDTNIGTAVTPSFTNTLSTRFDGVDDSVTMGNPASLQITGNMSISTWINTTDSSTYEIIVGKDGTTSGTRSYFLFRSGSNAKFLIFRGASAFSVTGTSAINDGNWHHIVGVNDGTNLKIYVDGALEATTTSGGSIDNGNNPFYIGRRGGPSGDQGHFSGSIDETAIFNAELTASDVTTIYNSGAPNDLTGTSGLVSWWRMGDGDTFPTITDNQGSNDGTMTNMSSGNFITNVPT